MAAAGHANGIKGLDFLVRDVASFKIWAQAIQAMLQEGINVECNLRTVVESVWFDDTASGHYDLAIGAVVSTLLDPSDYFNAWYRTDGPQNYSYWANKQFDGAVRPDRPRGRSREAAGADPAGRGDHGAGPAGAAGGMGADQRRLVQLREGPQSEGLFRHLRRRAPGHVLAGQVAEAAPASAQKPPKLRCSTPAPPTALVSNCRSEPEIVRSALLPQSSAPSLVCVPAQCTW